MAAQAELGSGGSGGGKDDVKTQFATREGTYRLMTLAEYSRPNRAGCGAAAGAGGAGSTVRVSLVTLPAEPAAGAAAGGAPGAAPLPADPDASDDRICFNHGKELYVYVYRGVKKAADLTKPVDKKLYKGTNPTCHDFNTVTAAPDSVSLVIGFSTGQIQLIDPIKKELSKLYNEERLIDKSKVTCIKWVPGSSNLFVSAHASGALYVYNEELGCGTAAPHYQLFKQGDSYAVYTCRAKSTRNPLYRWSVGAEGSAVNDFAFSPCGANLAVVSQDGFLRVFHYDTMELVGRARSYFGGFLCACWSPDGKYVVVGGEDDLITVWCLADRRVVARCQGHRSWVSVVAFDPYAVGCGEPPVAEDDDSRRTAPACYRLGSVSQDTQLCLWDLTEDVLRPPVRARASAHLSPSAAAAHHAPALSPNGVPGVKLPAPKALKSNKIGHKHTDGEGDSPDSSKTSNSRTGKVNNVTALNITVGRADGGGGGGGVGGSLGVNSLTQRLAGFSFGERREHRRNFSLTSKPNDARAGAGNSVALRGKSAGVGADSYDPLKLIGTAACPRFDECPVLEPLVCKKIAHERLTSLAFRSDCIVTACADGCVYTWARPAPTHAQPLPSRHHNGELAHAACRAPPSAPTARLDRIHLVD